MSSRGRAAIRPYRRAGLRISRSGQFCCALGEITRRARPLGRPRPARPGTVRPPGRLRRGIRLRARRRPVVRRYRGEESQ